MYTEQRTIKKQHMDKRFSDRQAGPADRPGYSWLALGTLFSLFAVNGGWDLSLAAWIAPLFFLRFMRTRRLRSGLVGIWLSSVVISIFWMYRSNFYNPHLFSPVNLLMFAIILASHTLLVVPYLLDRLLTPRLALFSGLLASLIFPMGLVACEYINALVVPYGSFFSLGATQYGNLPLLQIAALTGVYGVSFLVAWFASASNWIWEQHRSWPKIRTVILLYSSVMVLVLLGGSIRLTFFAPSSSTVRVAGVSTPKATYQQAMESIASQNHPDRAQLRIAYTMVENALFMVSQREASSGAKIISWPEIEVSTLPEDEASLIARGQALAGKEHIYLEMAYRVVLQDQKSVHNRAVLIDPTGRVLWTYDKTHPAPGADPSIPGKGNIPVVDTPYGRLATVICLDAFYPTLMHQAGNRGIDMLIVPSQEWNDSAGKSMTWVTQATTLHAIEYGYSLVRQASGDVAMAVDDQGRVLAASDYHMTDQQTMVAYVPVKGTWTIYGMLGDLFTWLCIVGLFVLTVFVVTSFMRRSRNTWTSLPEWPMGNADEQLEIETARL